MTLKAVIRVAALVEVHAVVHTTNAEEAEGEEASLVIGTLMDPKARQANSLMFMRQ